MWTDKTLKQQKTVKQRKNLLNENLSHKFTLREMQTKAENNVLRKIENTFQLKIIGLNVCCKLFYNKSAMKKK